MYKRHLGLLIVVSVTILGGCSSCDGGSSRLAERASADHARAWTKPSMLGTTSTSALIRPGASPSPPASPDGGRGTVDPTRARPLSGKVVAIDPGHNGGNFTDPRYVNSIVWNGRKDETCDTTGTETDAGYTEAQFNFNVAEYLVADLRSQGATVVITRTSNTGVGPCITRRAEIGNDAHADAVVSIHADGGPANGYGFAILEPVADGPNDAVIDRSHVLALDLRSAFVQGTSEAVSTYDGINGLEPRDDLGGLNLTTVPKVLIECANMRNSTDATKLITPKWQAEAAASIAKGIGIFLLTTR